MRDENSGSVEQNSPFTSVPIEISVCVGKARAQIGELLQLGENSVLTLDKLVDDPVELFVGDKLIARGELEEVVGQSNGQLVVRLTEIAEISSGIL